MKNTFYLLLLFLFACKTQEIPPKHVDLSERKYNQYCTMLKDARAKKDYFNEGSALCNLKQPSEKVYKLLQKGIKQNDSVCYEVHYLQSLYKRGSMTFNMIKLDTSAWEKLCKSCEKIVSIEKFQEKQEREIAAYQKKNALKQSALDSNLFDKKLIGLLKDIFKKDQDIRRIPFLKDNDPKWKEQKHLDSLNLVNIDRIFKAENGYPKIEKIGNNCILIPWYILHHQSSSIVRRKYQHFIEEAVEKGYLGKSMLETYNERTLTTEERERKERP
jgi:hypothetical protein